jgi:hypothetical protein
MSNGSFGCYDYWAMPVILVAELGLRGGSRFKNDDMAGSQKKGKPFTIVVLLQSVGIIGYWHYLRGPSSVV